MPRHENILVMILMLVILNGCLGLFESEKKPADNTPKIFIMNNDSNYVGVPLRFIAVFPQPAEDYSQLSWKTGSGIIMSQSSGKDSKNIKSDTVLLEWKSLPKAVKLDDKSNDYVYLDTIRVTANGLVSKDIIVSIINLFPNLTKITINGYATIPKGDSIFVKVHRGSLLNIGIYYHDLLKVNLYDVDWPDFMKINGLNPVPKVSPRGDVQTFHFGEAPEGIFDKSGTLTIVDGDGASQQWTLRYQTYQETGSIWVGSRNELIKLSSSGMEIFRDSLDLPNIITMDIFKNELYIVDNTESNVVKFNTLDFSKSKDRVFTNGKTVQALKAVDRYIWVAHDGMAGGSQIVQYEPAPNLAAARHTITGIPGSVLSMSTNRRISGSLWFLNSVESRVYFSVGDTIRKKIDGVITNPLHVSYDPDVNFCWVASRNVLVMLDTAGNKWGSIKGFGNIVSISAGLGFCLVVDHYNRRVYSFDHSITDNRTIGPNDMYPSEFSKELDFPSVVAMVNQKERECWVAVEGRGSVVKLDSTGKELYRFAGMLNPQQISVNTGK